MKPLGIVRKVDDLGRFVIPIEWRKKNGIEEDTPIELFATDNGMLVLRPYKPVCIICGEIKDGVIENERKVCNDCIKKLNEKIKIEK
jgi:transcriptional pleiotropic regulator of transition state genes